MYGIFLALGEFGPGDCMGLNAMELFPTAVRGTGYGIAAGKVLNWETILLHMTYAYAIFK